MRRGGWFKRARETIGNDRQRLRRVYYRDDEPRESLLILLTHTDRTAREKRL